jgi:DinB superfamily
VSLDHRAILAHIRSAPVGLTEAVAAVPPGQHDRPPRAGEWSTRETLIHVRNVVMMVYGLRIRRLLYEQDPIFADYDEEAFRREDLARREPVEDLVRMITVEHEQIGRLLDGLADDRWALQGRHPELGAMSVAFLADRVGAHTDEHAQQIRDTARAL